MKATLGFQYFGVGGVWGIKSKIAATETKHFEDKLPNAYCQGAGGNRIFFLRI